MHAQAELHEITTKMFRIPGHVLSLAITTIAVLLLVPGCGSQDQIRRYQVERPKPPHRMLGAIVPQGERAWFFKVTGADELVAAQTKHFNSFVESIQFGEQEDSDPTWELPEGWRQTAGADMRFATIEIPTDEKLLELSVIPLPGQGGEPALVANVNRWRGQLGLAPIDASELEDNTTQLDAAGVTATVVNITGKLGAGAPMAGPFAGGAPFAGGGPSDVDPVRRAANEAAGNKTASQLSFEAPEEWKPGQLVKSGGGFSVPREAAFIIDEKAEVTITSLSAAAGATLLNVNRWRGQIGLGPLSEDALQDATTEIDVGGEPAPYFRLVGSEQAILAVIAIHDGKSWFIKLQGPHDLAVKREEEFKVFVRSIKY
jgi:hypothetical protein